MSESKHTPGPWKVEMSIYEHMACEIVGGRGLANVWNGPNAMADAYLMAASPEMLEKGKALVDRDCTYDGGNIIIPCGSHAEALRIMQEFRSTLARAEGRHL